MNKLRQSAWLALAAIVLNTTGVFAQSEFKKALVEHLKLKKSTSVSCNACHVSGKPKTMRNDLGKMFDKQFKAAGIKLPKKLDTDEKKAAARKAFLDALKKVEAEKFPGGGTYGEAMKSGKVSGIKME